jgi:MazG family protein
VSSDALEALLALMKVMERLRDPLGGCPWDLRQRFETIAPYTIEEAYEVADAIARGDFEALCDELGDLLFQVVFHAHLAQERGLFDLAAVARGIAQKLTRRHPHVFGGTRYSGAAEQSAAWEQFKASERESSGAQGALAGVARALPALTRAHKLGRRAGRLGFDWADAGGARAKMDEELAELEQALAGGREHDREAEEFGDLLFAMVNWGRHLGLDPEAALQAANRKFERRFALMEQIAAQRGLALARFDARTWDELWNSAKTHDGELDKVK